MASGNKLRSLIRGTDISRKEESAPFKNSTSTDVNSAKPTIVLKDLLKLEKAPQEEVVPQDPSAPISSRIDFRLRQNIQQYQLFQNKKLTAIDKYKQTADSVVLGSLDNSRAKSYEKTNLPSIDATPSRAIRTFMKQAALSTSVDYSSSHRSGAGAILRGSDKSFGASGSYRVNSERDSTSEDIAAPRNPHFKQLRPASRKLPSLFKDEVQTSRMPLKTYERVLGRTDKREARELRERNKKLGKADVVLAGLQAVSKGVLISSIDFVQGFQSLSLNHSEELPSSIQSGQNSTSKLVRGRKHAQLPIAELPTEGLMAIKQQGEFEIKGLLGSGAIESIFQKNAITDQEMLDEQELIYYIKMLFNDESDSAQFVYALNTRSDLPYNLRPVSHETALEKNLGFYYTISKEKVTKYNRQHLVVEFSEMDEWLREKLRFNQLKTLELVRKFRKIKALKAWVRQIRQFKKNYAAKMVELKLPLLDPLLCKPILDFKAKCLEIEDLNYFVLSSDRQFSISQLKARQERATDHFKDQLESRNTKMKEIVQEVIVAFNQQLKDCAFQEMTEDLRAGLAAIKMPDPALYTDSIELEGEMLAFFHKLMTLNIPYRVKSKIRNLCHKVLSLPTIFDNLRLSSLLNCYGYNLERFSDFIQDAKERNTDEPVVWIDPKPKSPPKKLYTYVMINFSINEKLSAEDAREDLETNTEQFIRTGAETSIEPRNFDFMSNWSKRGFGLVDITDYDVTRLHEYTNYQDLSDMIAKAYMFDRTYPETHSVRSFARPEENLVQTDPDFSTLKDFLVGQYNTLLDELSTYERTSGSGNFNMFYKLLFYWENEDYRPDFKTDRIELRDIVGEVEFKKFHKSIVAEIEQDYRAVYTISKQLAAIAMQHWRNCQVQPEGRLLSLTHSPGCRDPQLSWLHVPTLVQEFCLCCRQGCGHALSTSSRGSSAVLFGEFQQADTNDFRRQTEECDHRVYRTGEKNS